MASQATTVNKNADEIYHDPSKQDRIIAAFKQEIENLGKIKLRLADELKEFQTEEVKETKEQKEIFDRLQELNDLIPEQRMKIAGLGEKLTDFQRQRARLEYQRVERKQKFDKNQNEIEERRIFLEEFEEELAQFNDEKFNLEQRKSLIENEKSIVERKLIQLDGRMKQYERQVNSLKQPITNLESEIGINHSLLENLQANVKSNEGLTEKLHQDIQENENRLSDFSKESDRFNEDLIRLKHLIDQISIIIEMKEKNTNQFAQLKVNLQHDSNRAQEELKDIREEIQKSTAKIAEIEKSIQPIEKKLAQLLKESSQLKDQLNELTEVIEQGERALEQKEENVNQLKEQKELIDEEIEMQKDEVNEETQFKNNIQDFDRKERDLKAELKMLEQSLPNDRINRNHCVEEMNEAKKLIKQCQTELLAATENRIATKNVFRQQEQLIQNIQEQLLKYQYREQSFYSEKEKVELEVRTAQTNFEFAEKSFNEAKMISESLSNYITANPGAEVAGVVTKEKLMEKYRKDIEKCQIDLTRKHWLLVKRNQDFNQAKANTNKTEYLLEAEQKKLEERNGEAKVANEKVSAIERRISQIRNDIDHVEKQYDTFQQQSEEIEENIRGKNKEIQSTEQERFEDERKLNLMEKNFNTLKTRQGNYIKLVEQAEIDLGQSRSELKKNSEESLVLRERINESKVEQNSLIGIIAEKRAEIDTFRFQLNPQLQEEYRINGKITNLQETFKLTDQNDADLKTQLNQEKTLLYQRENGRPELDQKIKYSEKKKEDLEQMMQTYEGNQRKFHRDLQIKYREIIRKRLECSRLKYQNDQHQIQLKIYQEEYNLYKEQQSTLTELLEQYENEIKEKEKQISETQKKIESREAIPTEIQDDETMKKMENETDGLDTAILELLPQYRDEKDRQDEYFIDIRLIQDLKMNLIEKCIVYEQNLFDRKMKINGHHHQIASKENELRNYRETQSRYKLDLYAELLK